MQRRVSARMVVFFEHTSKFSFSVGRVISRRRLESRCKSYSGPYGYRHGYVDFADAVSLAFAISDWSGENESILTAQSHLA